MDTPLWLQIWQAKLFHILSFTAFLVVIIMVMIFKDWLSKRKRIQDVLRYGILGTSLIYVGLVLKAQPTTTNIVILVNSATELQFPFGLYLLEPYLFLSFIFMFLTLLFWGRGVFCGWLCPYGAMLELFNKLVRKIFSKGQIELPERIHSKLIYVKYLILLLIIGVSFYSFILSEYLTEIEPFRTFVLKLNREWYFVLYFIIISLGSVIIYRAFCRYLCPLGAALAIPAYFKKVPFVKMKRDDFCSTCKICARVCAPRAISSNGIIDSRECMDCLDCQVNFWDEDVCPVLIKRKREGGRP